MAERESARAVTLWDAQAEPGAEQGIVYCWNGYAETGGKYSVLRYVEQHGERLRARYLKWIHDLGDATISGRRVIDALIVEEGFSYWWLTLLAEKSPWKSPCIKDVIRLFAVEEILATQNASSLRVVTGNRKLAITLRDYCRVQRIEFRWERAFGVATSGGGVFARLPDSVRALASLGKYLWRRWCFRTSPVLDVKDQGCGVFFCSYLFHLDAAQARQGRFHSRYWEDLPRLIDELGLRQNWVEIFYPHPEILDAAAAIELIRQFNGTGRPLHSHCMIDAYLDWPVVFDALSRWLSLFAKSWRLRSIRPAFTPDGSALSLWPLMRSDWHASLRGSVAISNCLWLALFDAVLSRIPHQPLGLYLCENQAWERAFIHCWRKYGHGRLIAVPHSTARFWDLRCFFHPATIGGRGAGSIPLPDIIAVNGKVALDGHLASGYRPDMIAASEALRYNYLEASSATVVDRLASTARPLNVLILGDFQHADNLRMMKMLEAAVVAIPSGTKFVAKPHPNTNIRAEDYPTLQLTVTTDHLSKIMNGFDVAYSSNMTSAALDAYLAGLAVVVMLDDVQLNFSPLRGQPGVQFVADPAALAEAIRSAVGHEAWRNESEFFFLDPKLPRWRRILAGSKGHMAAEHGLP